MMTVQTRTWSSKRGEEVGISIDRFVVAYWRTEPHNIKWRVPLHEFVHDHIGVDQAASLIGEEKTVQAFAYAVKLLTARTGCCEETVEAATG